MWRIRKCDCYSEAVTISSCTAASASDRAWGVLGSPSDITTRFSDSPLRTIRVKVKKSQHTLAGSGCSSSKKPACSIVASASVTSSGSTWSSSPEFVTTRPFAWIAHSFSTPAMPPSWRRTITGISFTPGLGVGGLSRVAVGSIGEGKDVGLAAGSVDTGADSPGKQADRRKSSIRVEQSDVFNY